ncbi:unnamed protein product [Paramecium pentaurelia]|uniref:Uncharacterized protein n=1 Tax=Paramecium pentaurelia TaxID=43138 RepID=A0A8S1S9B0_9CILI|nr:unnamed protein product [Paramecium pentaurelia]
MKQQFLQIRLQDSQQERSCISLENMIEMLKDPDFIQKCQQCQYDYELIELFPLVGYGITIIKTKKNSETKIKVTQFSKVEKIIDLTYLDLKKISRKEGMPNCILPLLSSQEANAELLTCELFKRKISYIVHEKLDSYKEDTYFYLLQASIHHIIKKEGIQSWGREIMFLVFETCKQVFINTPFFCNSIATQQFQQSKFQLLNLFCLFQMGQLTTEKIFQHYIKPNIILENYQKLDEDQIQIFFDNLRFENINQIYENIFQFMENYLRENNYFIIKLTQKKIIYGVLDYMIPKENQWENLEKLQQIQDQGMEIQKLKYFTISTIYLKLLNNLFEEYNDEKKIKYFQSFSQHYEEDNEQSFQYFLMQHIKYQDIYEIYELYKQTQNNFQEDDPIFIEKYQFIAIRFIVNKIPIDQIKNTNPQSYKDLKQLKELERIQEYLQIFQKIFSLSDVQAKQINKIIIEEVQNLTWLNYLSSITNFKEENSIKQFLLNFISHLQGWKSKQQQEACAKNLIELSRFSFLLLQRTRMLGSIKTFNQQQLQEILTRDRQKEFFCKKIFEVSKTIKG